MTQLQTEQDIHQNFKENHEKSHFQIAISHKGVTQGLHAKHCLKMKTNFILVCKKSVYTIAFLSAVEERSQHRTFFEEKLILPAKDKTRADVHLLAGQRL